jgi:hypothetical protein
MRKLIVILLTVVAFPASSIVRAQTEIPVVPSSAADAKVYGEYPMAYKEMITRWMETRLVDPASAVFEWMGEPRPGELSPKKGERVVGYIVDFKVNARNQFGAATGKQRYQVVIRNGDVVWGGRPRS